MEEVFEYDLGSIALTLGYSLFGVAVLILLLARNSSVRKNDFVALLLSFALMISFFLANHFLKLKTLPPDTAFYADIVRDFWRHYDAWSPGVKLYAIINFVPIQLSLSYPVVLVVIHVLFYLAGIILIGKAWAVYSFYRERNLPRDFYGQLLLLSAIYPAALIVVPSLLREGSMFFFFGLTTYLLVLIRYSDGTYRRVKIALFAISLLLLTLIRPIGGVSYILAMLSLYFLDLWQRNKLQALVRTILPAALGIWIINLIADSFYNMRFSPYWLGLYRASHKELFGTEAYGTDLPWEGWLSIAESSSLLFLQYTFSPLPVIIEPEVMMEKTIPLIDALFLILCLIPLVYALKEKVYRRFFLFALVLLIVPALFETHISGSYRHRMNGIVLLLPLVVIGLNKLLVDLSKLASDYIANEKRDWKS